MDIAIFTLLGIYLLEHLLLYAGLLVNTKKADNAAAELPFVSVIVAARNEEDNIAACIRSLIQVDYPQEKLQVILVNDRSTDKTKDIMLSYTNENKILTYLDTTNTVIGNLKGKTNALAMAIGEAKGEIIFTTDADIMVKPSWIREMMKYYDSKTGVINSFSTILPKNFFRGLQSFDWLYLLGLASGGDGLGHPISCVGNNMSYRKSAYDEVGGYEKIKFSVTEDFMMLQSIMKKTKWKSKFPVNIDIVNETYACLSLKELYRQKKRWATGGLDAHSAGMIAGAMAFLSGLVILFGWIAGLKPYIAFVISKTVIDAFFVFPVVKEFKMWKAYLYLPFFELYFAVYVFLMPFILLFGGKVVWKEQKL
jgi:cellulose synthase/poly-beta-1,6-N-acetylglucosamine synthase-like glycosyltransferase